MEHVWKLSINNSNSPITIFFPTIIQIYFLSLMHSNYFTYLQMLTLKKSSLAPTILRASHRAYANLASSQLNSLNSEDVNYFTKILPSVSIISTLGPSPSPSEDLHQYNNDWMGKYTGQSTTVLKPKTTQQVSQIVKYCNQRRIGIVPQGGNTGLVGGGTPIKDELVLSLTNMNKVRSFDPISGHYSPYFSPFAHSAELLLRHTRG